MARLNDPPIAPPVESVDALKRRFIRQNREIARVNSTQSLRIRNLEAEISRLLAENIAIREQAINIAQESEKWRAAYKATREISNLKSRLEEKLQEVNNIVTELGELPERATKRKSATRKSISIARGVRSPDEKEWRNRQTIGGVLNAERAEQEGRLPAILEDKAYPRRTLDHSELQTPIDEFGNPLESPELGPPPVAHFDVPESIDYNANTDPEKSPQPQRQIEPVVPLSVNLENRRKRRTSALLQDIPVEKNFFALEEQIQQPVTTSKAGAKRKLDGTALDDKRNPALVSTEDFVFKKAERDIDSRGTRFTRPVRKDRQDVAPISSPAKDAPAMRKILAPKSTNSPTKARIRVGDKPPVKRNELMEELKIPKRANRVDATATAMSQEWKQDDFHAMLQGQLPPKTPFSTDSVSPVSTEPSVRVQEMAITNSVEDVLNGSIGRGSRRARAAVSYAEPNLRDKMRRPGKELVGAVEGIDKRSREESVDRERGRSEDPTPRVSQVKQERLDIPADWKKLPHAKEEAPSPLRDKTSKSPEEVKANTSKSTAKKRISGKAVQGVSADYTSDFAITDDAELENAVRRLSIFDPPTSSPASGRISGGPYPDNIDIEPLKRSKSTTAVTTERKARRHSVATNPSSTLNHSRSVSDIGSSARPSSRQSSVGLRPSSAASLRPSSAASQRPTSAASLKDGEKSTSSMPNLSRQTSTSRFGTKEKVRSKTEEPDVAATRASRRRSMVI
jgi:hypothetical protein